MAQRNQELYCHNCNKYVQFRIDDELDGKHILKCPNCQHEHYRYVNNGEISDRRWGSSNALVATYYVASAYITTSSASVAFSSSASSDSCSTANTYIVWGMST